MASIGYHTSIAIPRPPQDRSSHLLGRWAAPLYGLLTLAARQVAIRRARRELLELPDSMLKDMGITRGEVPSVVEFGRAVVARPLRSDASSESA